ncbi:hypothetical protein MOUN0_K00540 [Monosporozyma unispora]|nr:hypothetical protein C6P44_004116 [Kazachstania unispora]
MLLDELPIFEHIKNDILIQHSESKTTTLPGASNVNRLNNNTVRKKIIKKVEYTNQSKYKQPPLSAYSAIDTRPFYPRNCLNERDVLIERRRLQLATTKILGIKLFKPIGYRYRHVKIENKISKDKDKLLECINDISRGSDMIINNSGAHNSFQFHESSGLMINMNQAEPQVEINLPIHDSLIVPRNILAGGSELFSDENESNEYDDASNGEINSMENIDIQNMERRQQLQEEEENMRSDLDGRQFNTWGQEIEPGSIRESELTHLEVETEERVRRMMIPNGSIPQRNVESSMFGVEDGGEIEESDKSMDEYLDEVEDEDW